MDKLPEKLTELWAFVRVKPEGKERVEEDRKKLNKESPVKAQNLWDHYIRGNHCFILKIRSETLTKKSEYFSFLNRLTDSNFSVDPALPYDIGQTDREITPKGESLIERTDFLKPSPVSPFIGLYLHFVNDGVPTNIIKKMEYTPNLKHIDSYCVKNGFVNPLG